MSEVAYPRRRCGRKNSSKAMSASGDKQANERCLRLQAHGEQLIPGIPNDITLGHITTKMPWISVRVLSSVSRGWLHAIRTHEVHQSRVLSDSTEAFVLLAYDRSQRGLCCNVRHRTNTVLGLYSVRDNICYELPPIPDLPNHRRLPYCSRYVSLDGKVFVLGGRMRLGLTASDEVHTLDLAGQRQWERCASMREPRQNFACGVLHGKIYVFGGSSNGKPIYRSEVYDPKKNVWIPIKPMISERQFHHVEIVGEELLVHGESTFYGWGPLYSDRLQPAYIVEVYCPGKDEWRTLELVDRNSRAKVFTARGKFHFAGERSIDIYDADKNSWTHVPVRGAFHHDSVPVHKYPVLAVENELVALEICEWDPSNNLGGMHLVRSRGRGFSSGNKKILWEKARFSGPCTHIPKSRSHALYPIWL